MIPPMTTHELGAEAELTRASVKDKISKKTNKVKPKPQGLLKYRWMIFGRFVLAIFGGYAFSALSAMCIANAFPEMRTSAVLSATMLSFVVHCAVFIWVFLVNSTIKAWLGVLIPCVVFFLLNLWLKG